jgi:MFS family permease
MEKGTDFDEDSVTSSYNHSHQQLRAHPILWGTVGISQTLLTAGVVFGWASLLPVLREQGIDFTPEQFSLIFSVGAIGNYLSTLFFGLLLDNFGPKMTGITASILYSFGLTLCYFVDNYMCLLVGFGLVGFSGPGIQMPTLHLANLFPTKNGGTGAFYMSAQAAAFDGGTIIFFLVRLAYQITGFRLSRFFLFYNIVPICSLLTAIFVWPKEILDSPEANQHEIKDYIGVGSPYLSPAGRKSIREGHLSQGVLVNAPLSTILRHPSFWVLSTWGAIHILKLNFVVATINDQLDQNVDSATADHLIDVLGAMLPFGFVALPLVATFLDRAPLLAFQLANLIGIMYGGVMSFCPGSSSMEAFIVFPSVACSRQLVYSTLFHQVGAIFGFANYGVLLGLINVTVSACTTIQTPLVNWSESIGSYYWANLLLLMVTVPLFFSVLYSNPSGGLSHSGSGRKKHFNGKSDMETEHSRLLDKKSAVSER